MQLCQTSTIYHDFFKFVKIFFYLQLTHLYSIVELYLLHITLVTFKILCISWLVYLKLDVVHLFYTCFVKLNLIMKVNFFCRLHISHFYFSRGGK